MRPLRSAVNCTAPLPAIWSGPSAPGETLAQVEKKQAGYVAPGERDDLAALRENTQFRYHRLRAHRPRRPSLAGAPDAGGVLLA